MPHDEEIIDTIGYPTIAKVGKAASEAAWLIVQHAISEPKLMKRCYGLLTQYPEDVNPQTWRTCTTGYVILKAGLNGMAPSSTTEVSIPWKIREKWYGCEKSWDYPHTMMAWLKNAGIPVRLICTLSIRSSMIGGKK